MHPLHAHLRVHADAHTPALPDGDLWVFAYGSLMWDPGFAFLERRPARLFGYHRALCVWSHVHRGTPDHPGMVLGLDRGGSCCGYVYRIDASVKQAVADYLYAREMPTPIYRAQFHPVQTDDGRRLSALSFFVDRAHPQYAGRVKAETAAARIRQARGVSGCSLDYLRNTLEHLENLGIHDRRLAAVARLTE